MTAEFMIEIHLSASQVADTIRRTLETRPVGRTTRPRLVVEPIRRARIVLAAAEGGHNGRACGLGIGSLLFDRPA